MKNVIEIDHLSKGFGDVKAVDDLSFRVKEGQLFAFLGVNGAGKSTTINIMCGQLEVDFVCNLGSARYYIQLAYFLPDEAKRNQEIRPFRKIDDSFKKIVITKDIVPAHYDEYGILMVNIYDFLLNREVLKQ